MTESSTTEVLFGTDYFEIDSVATGVRFAVWVTRPAAYDAQPDVEFPVLYVTDGNLLAALTAPYANAIASDPLAGIQPFVQVSIGYAGAGLPDFSWMRNRDLMPPHEPPPPELEAGLEAAFASGAMTRAEADRAIAAVRDPHGDRFLDFIENELHPVVTGRYRVRPGRCGLFGYSLGGLFSLYALVRQSPLFDRIGAGSAGLLSPESQIFVLLDEFAKRRGTFDDVRLCLTVNNLEATGSFTIYRHLARGVLELVDKLQELQLEGLTVTTLIVPEETHLSGITASYLRFLRACFSTASATARG